VAVFVAVCGCVEVDCGFSSVSDAQTLLAAQSGMAFGGDKISIHRPGTSPTSLRGMLRYVDFRVSESEIKSEFRAQGFALSKVTHYRQADGFCPWHGRGGVPRQDTVRETSRFWNSYCFMQHAVHRKITVVQCFKCEGFGHIASRCRKMSPAGLHCAGDHVSKECLNRDQVKCANCGLAHKAFMRRVVGLPPLPAEILTSSRVFMILS
jgi:hypothetical protein